jgi:hypothetical protein
VIDFRYHLVSIVAVFLALAIGIVLGSTELQGPVYNVLQHTTSSLEGKLSDAQNQAQTAQQGLDADNAMLASSEAWDLRGMLDNQRVVVLTEPNAQPAVITGVETALKDAGATVTGQINLQPKFFNNGSATAASLETTNTQLAQSDGISVNGSDLSYQQQATAQVFAEEFLTKSSAGPTGIQTTGNAQSTQAQTALDAYQSQGFLTTSGEPSTQATLAVVVTPQVAPADGTADPLAQVLGPFAEELAKYSSGTVVAGTQAASGAGSPIAELRATSSVSNQVSSVDDADSVRGQESVVAALYSTLSGGQAQSYGISAGTYPTLNPATLPSPSATPSSSSSKKPHK